MKFCLYCKIFLRTCMLQTLRNVVHTLEYVKSKGVTVRFHGRGKNEASHYCGQCEVRVTLKKTSGFR